MQNLTWELVSKTRKTNPTIRATINHPNLGKYIWISSDGGTGYQVKVRRGRKMLTINFPHIASLSEAKKLAAEAAESR